MKQRQRPLDLFFNMPKLSILICSLESRKHLLARLLAHLEVQLRFLPDPSQVEILVETDNGEKTTGEKRNILLDRAAGEYCCHWDDDDLTAPNSLELILKALEPKPDAVGINLIMTTDGGKAERSFHVQQFNDKEWFQINDPIQPNHFIFFRGINHINPILTSLSRQVRFPEITQGEDRDFAYRVCPLVKTMTNIEQPIYFYLFNSQK